MSIVADSKLNRIEGEGGREGEREERGGEREGGRE